MSDPYMAIFTGPPQQASLLVIFNNREPEVLHDVESTRANLEQLGLHPLVRGYTRLADVPDTLRLVQPDALVVDPSVPSPAQRVNLKYQNQSGEEAAKNGSDDYYGDTYQNGVPPGPRKLAQFLEVLELMGTPKLYAQENQGEDAIVYVKLFVSAR